MDYKHGKILIGSELDEVTNDHSDYVNLDLPSHIIIYGSKGSGKTLNTLTMANTPRKRDIPNYYVKARENQKYAKIYGAITKISNRGHDIDEVKSRFDSL